MGSAGDGGKKAESFLPQPGISADLSPSEPLSAIYHSAYHTFSRQTNLFFAASQWNDICTQCVPTVSNNHTNMLVKFKEHILKNQPKENIWNHLCQVFPQNGI